MADIDAVVFAKIVFADGQSTDLEHRLSIEERENDLSPQRYGDISAGNTATYVGKNRLNWAMFIESDDGTLDRIDCAEYTLHPTFPNPLPKVCDKGTESGRGFFLTANGWGTFTVKTIVVFEDGEAQYYKHQLSFSR